MKLIWILFTILLDLAWKLAMIVLAFYLIVAIGMGLYWLFFESAAGSALIAIAVLLIIFSVIGATTDNIKE